jgi:hypothetical protein
VSPVKYKLGFYIPGDDIIHSHRRDKLNLTYFLTWSNMFKQMSENGNF